MRGLWITFENALFVRDLPERLANALWDAFFGHTVTAGSYRAFVEVSPATATADLRVATAADLLVASGERRGRTYLPGRRMFAEVAADLDIDELPESADEARAMIVTALARRLTGPAAAHSKQLTLALPDGPTKSPAPASERVARTTAD